MKTKLFITGLVLTLFSTLLMNAQSFRKGTWLIGISEGTTWAHYTTSDVKTNQVINDAVIKGDRDPLQIEYGVSNKWGISVSFGNDIFKVNPQQFYKYSNADIMKSKSSESLIEANYHFFVTNQWDLVAFAGIGCFKVELYDKDSKCVKNPIITYKNGGIFRSGIKARYYFTNRWAILGMCSMFSANAYNASPVINDVIIPRIQTTIKGLTIEFGVSYKIKK